ncbi:MAG: S9 family peptidase [Caulobacteraceae bacterium]|nr:S9 family peptidase [Caulobacteraceae bacterium]
MGFRFFALAFAAAVSLLCAGGALARPFTARDLATLDRLSDPQVSPDGRFVAYDLRTADYEANTARHAIWLVCASCRTGAPRRLSLGGKDATNPRWAPDGRFFHFLSGRSGNDQVWRSDTAGVVATQVTRLPLDVGAFRLSPDGKRIVVSQAVFPGAEDPAATKARLDAAKAGKSTGVLHDRLFARHWDAWADGTRNHLFSLALDANGVAAGAPVPLMTGFDGDAPSKPFGDDADFTISPDGATVVFSARVAGKSEPWSTNFDLWSAPIDGSAAPRNLTADNPACDAQPVFSPDGRALAWRAQKRPSFETDRFGVWVMDLKTGAKREVDPTWDRSAAWLGWANDGHTVFVTAEDVGQTRLFSIDVAGGAVKPLTADGDVNAVSVAGSSVVYARDSLDGPAQLHAPLAEGSTQLTHIDGDTLAGIQFSPFEPFTFPGWNGETVHGYVVKPYGYRPGKTYPVIFLIHGGPQGSWSNSWSYRWNPQVWAGWGYAVVTVDFHGSTGYGQAFTDAISQHWGDRPLEDLQKGWSAALAKYPFLDGKRACAAGASYGGYMVYWIAGVWSGPWKCLIDHDGVFDNRMMGFSTEELWFSEWENGGTPWDNPKGYERFNPILHVADWSKPMLVIHSARDYRIPLEQGLAAFTALQRKGIPSEFLTFPDENHWVLKPRNSVEWHDTVEAWLKRWIPPS